MITNFKKEYEKIEGKPFWYIKEKPVYRTVRKPGGYDHLGQLPDTVFRLVDRYEYEVVKEFISPDSLVLLLDEECYFNEEDANWAVLNKKEIKLWKD